MVDQQNGCLVDCTLYVNPAIVILHPSNSFSVICLKSQQFIIKRTRLVCWLLHARKHTRYISSCLACFRFLMCHRQCRKRGPRKHHYGVGSYEISEESSSRGWSHWSLYRERCFVHVFLSYFVLLFASFFGLLIFLKVILVIEFLSVTLSSPFPSSVFFVF